MMALQQYAAMFLLAIFLMAVVLAGCQVIVDWFGKSAEPYLNMIAYPAAFVFFISSGGFIAVIGFGLARAAWRALL